LYQEEKKRLEQEQRRVEKEWNATLKLIKDEAKTEIDEELAKMLKEKEELLAQLEQFKNNQGGHIASVTLDAIAYPDYWQDSVSDFQIFEVARNSAEWYRVSSQFSQGLPGTYIRRIQRNQNRTLWNFYFLKREVVGANNGGDPNEQFLFHGSRNDAYDTIVKEGLDHRVAALGGAIGAGIYFAPSSSTSSGYLGGGNAKKKKMLYCRVTLGDIGPGQHGLRRPPEKRKGKLYDSVSSPGMHVIFDNHQSYPEYIIHF